MRLLLIVVGILLSALGAFGAWYAFGDALGKGFASGIGGRGGGGIELRLVLYGLLTLIGLGILLSGLFFVSGSGGE